MDYVLMIQAYEELGMIPLLVRHNLAWAARVLNYDESRLPKVSGQWEEAEGPASSAVV